MLPQRAFEPEYLSRIDRLILGVRRARSSRAGQRPIGRIQGIGIELENFKDYLEGDDLRFLDWNAMARLDELVTKSYRVEREVEISVLIDTSASMTLPEAEGKLGLALAVGATLAYVGMSENDAVRLVLFGGRQGVHHYSATEFHRRREFYNTDFRPFVSDPHSGGETRMLAAVEQLLIKRRQPGMVILISDFLVPPLEYESALQRLAGARNETKVIRVLSDTEEQGELPRGTFVLRDSESGVTREVALGDEALRSFRRRLAAHGRRLQEFCTRQGIEHATVRGTADLEQFLVRELPRLGIMR